MSFEQLVDKVCQAELALEAQERRAAADWRQLRQAWRDGWTPLRIIGAGLLGGFAVGQVQPMRAVTGSGTLQLLSALAGLFAGGSAQAAAGEAENAAATAAQAATRAAPEVGMPDMAATTRAAGVATAAP
jgi:hypothetical protein